MVEGYLDIETTNLDPSEGEITVIGIGIEKDKNFSFFQLVGEEINTQRLIEFIKEIDIIYTYNGRDFDLSFIRQKLGIDITSYCEHKDLKLDCWKKNLYGGLKEVESKLKIERKAKGINGYMAKELWKKYKYFNDRDSLFLLLEYNKEDVLNLKLLKEALNIKGSL